MAGPFIKDANTKYMVVNYNNQVCIEAGWMYKEAGLMTEFMYKHMIVRHQLKVVRRGCKNTPALIEFGSMPERLKQAIRDKIGDPYKRAFQNSLLEHIRPDSIAAEFFANYHLPDGRNLPFDVQKEYMANATILNAITGLLAKRKGARIAIGMTTKGIWPGVSMSVNSIERDLSKGGLPHTLPANARRLQDKYRDYLKRGYSSLIHGNWSNQNSRKVTQSIERLICSIYTMENLPFGSWVHDYYLQFIAGALIIADKETGEAYDRQNFFDEKKGTYIQISESTVWNILNDPVNAIIIDRMRNNRIDHITHKAPYNLRHTPQYSLSKISMDDRTLPRLTTNGQRVNMYYAFDVMSGVILGQTISKDAPSTEMVMDCFRSLFMTIEENNLLWPAEVEVENHLMRGIEDKLNDMFQFVTFGIPGLSRGKRAEHLIRAKKYGDERRYQNGIGRWNGKGVYKIKSENKDEEFKQERLAFETIYAEELESQHRWNHSLHPNQKIYPGKTRWQVLCDNMNPDLSRPQKYKLLRSIGYATDTSLRNNAFARVQYADYAIDSLECITRMKPNNNELQAYWLPLSNGTISELFLYQDNQFISKATKVERYNEAKAERTSDDERIKLEHDKRQAHFRKFTKDGVSERINRNITIEKAFDYETVEVTTTPAQPEGPKPEQPWSEADSDFYVDKALDY